MVWRIGNKRFGEIQRDITDILPKMLLQELKALEMNKIIVRTLHDTMPISTEYALTDLGRSMHNLLEELMSWGFHFRKEVIGK